MMKTVLLLVAGAIAVSVGVVLVLAAMKPDTFHVERSTRIEATPEKIYPLLADYRAWRRWSPYEFDPAMKRNYSGAESGAGSIYEWDGKDMGSGRMEMLEASPSKFLIKLDFFKPFEANNMAAFTLEPEQGEAATKVTWSLDGPLPFTAKVMHVFVNMDKMVGGQMNEGLAKLKAAAES
ncbi:MAG: SRPBCC family protein [Parvibaculum sp.]|uniref:SRPBCC family protein n=1 Tax=Parvibaculum sp. TaxID=2024848 RepID=UPI0025DA7F7D|nr:SRPBCC family protein [Parvibaculum sp.]MCE9650032.1 SRPBCC family protein [Parvibaculum sp.]